MKRSERLEEAERLKALTGRDVDFRTIECGCDCWAYCEKCFGTGSYFEAFYTYCNHPVVDGPDLECDESGCAERERLRDLQEVAA